MFDIHFEDRPVDMPPGLSDLSCQAAVQFDCLEKGDEIAYLDDVEKFVKVLRDVVVSAEKELEKKEEGIYHWYVSIPSAISILDGVWRHRLGEPVPAIDLVEQQYDLAKESIRHVKNMCDWMEKFPMSVSEYQARKRVCLEISKETMHFRDAGVRL